MKVRFKLNGRDIETEAKPATRVIDLLRQDLGLTGTKEACGSGECGACTIFVDGESRLSCLMLAPQLEGKNVTTIEGISTQEHLHPLQEAFVRHGAIQCGFCTPGMVLAGIELLRRNPNPTREEIRGGISGNLCRCTGYVKIVNAIEAAKEQWKVESNER